jgi:hypothetical protein
LVVGDTGTGPIVQLSFPGLPTYRYIFLVLVRRNGLNLLRVVLN